MLPRFLHVLPTLPSAAFGTCLVVAAMWATPAAAEGSTVVPKLSICQTLLGADSSRCETVTDWSLTKEANKTLLEEPHDEPVTFMITVTEGDTRYLLSMTSLVNLTGQIPEGTQVRGMVATLQRGSDEAGYVSVASGAVGDTTSLCGCPMVDNGDLDVIVRDELGGIIDPDGSSVVEHLSYGEHLTVQLDAEYDLASANVVPGDSVRIQTCVTFASSADEGLTGCAWDGGAVRTTKACSPFAFDAYVQPKPVTINLVDVMGDVNDEFVNLSRFEAVPRSGAFTPPQPQSLIPGGEGIGFTLVASGTSGTAHVVEVSGVVSCADVVSCGNGDESVCVTHFSNDVSAYGDGLSQPLLASAGVDVTCIPHSCSVEEQLACDDGDPCTTDLCVDGVGCSHTPYWGPCDDGNACTQNEQCNAGTCGGGEVLSCDDGNACTNAFCDPGAGCIVEALNGDSCEDGDACTAGDICVEGSCTAGVGVMCDDSNTCTNDYCDPASGCVNAPQPGSCNDDNPCTANTQCVDGQCGAGSPVQCPGDGNPCTAMICEDGVGCVAVNVENGAFCSDQDACTTTDSCFEGECISGPPSNCDDTNACTVDSCHPATGCVNAPRDGACDDGDVCTGAGSCVLGQCQLGTAVNCDDENPCTVDSCNPNAAGPDRCVHSAVTGPVCDDGNSCTTGDSCVNGQCLPDVAVECEDNNPCTDDICDPSEGCQHIPNTSSCDDGDACTGPGQCSAGSCVAGVALDCDDGNSCSEDWCQPGVGCQYQPLSNVACDDNSVCTEGDVCVAGSCVGGPQMTCGDDNVCTTATCDPIQGCVELLVDGPCDDGDACTGAGACHGGVCQDGEAISCDDSNACTADFCDSTAGCVHVDRSNVPCDDGDNCTVGDTCSAGTCGGIAMECDDDDPCTDDYCSEGGCVNTHNTAPCDDGNACTDGDVCSVGTCHGGPALDCGGQGQCGGSVCDPAVGCVNQPLVDGESCDDGNTCTGCPWVQNDIHRGYRVKRANVMPGVTSLGGYVLWFVGFFDGGAAQVRFRGSDNLFFLVKANGTARLEGQVVLYDAGGGANPGAVHYDIAFDFVYRGEGVGGQGFGGPHLELPVGSQGSEWTDTWRYYDLTDAVMHRVDNDDYAVLIQRPANSKHPLQVGMRANNRNANFGASSWFDFTHYRGSDVFQGIGDINVDFEPVFCTTVDSCSQGMCLPGGVNSSCVDIAPGDYCTYSQYDYGAYCSGGPDEASCLIEEHFHEVFQEWLPCGSASGLSIGFTGKRRMALTSASAILQLLPTFGGGTGFLGPTLYCHPYSSYAGDITGRLTALETNVRMSDTGVLPRPFGVALGDLIVSSGTCEGFSVRDVLQRGEMRFSGIAPSGSRCREMTKLATVIQLINANFSSCDVDDGLLDLP